MPNFFYSRLAFSGIKKNAKLYIPYLLTCSICFAMYYILLSLSQNGSIRNSFSGAYLQSILMMGRDVIGIFSVIFLFYTYSFLNKRRQREIGVYHALGMEKKHIAKMLFFEMLFSFAASAIVGILSGILLQRLSEVFLTRLIAQSVNFTFAVSFNQIGITLLIFGVIFAVMLLFTVIGIYRKNTISLIKGSNVGEKEPKAKWVSAVLGVILLSGGYAISTLVKNPILLISLFLVAVVLVILGTYLLFNAVSIAVLKILKNNKKYYYKGSHFIAVSGMLYRMKQNATGLANICIFSTMVLVMLSSTVALYVGINDMVKKSNPYEIMIEVDPTALNENDHLATAEKLETLNQTIDSLLEKHGLKKENLTEYESFYLWQKRVSESGYTTLNAITQEDFNKIFDTSLSLKNDEIVVCQNGGAFQDKTFELEGRSFSVVPVPSKADTTLLNGFINSTDLKINSVIVTSSMMDEFKAEAVAVNSDINNYARHNIRFNTDKTGEASIAFNNELLNLLQPVINVNSLSASNLRADLQELYGGLFFLGIFLGLLFTIATVLILYYKQLSEGHDDRTRFEIMQKVGLSKAEVKRTIRSQVLTMFFLPLLVAFLHICFAFPSIEMILNMLQLTNSSLFVITTIICSAIFAVFYTIVFAITTKTYERIVRG